MQVAKSLRPKPIANWQLAITNSQFGCGLAALGIDREMMNDEIRMTRKVSSLADWSRFRVRVEIAWYSVGRFIRVFISFLSDRNVPCLAVLLLN
jgi:hypothetical protein